MGKIARSFGVGAIVFGFALGTGFVLHKDMVQMKPDYIEIKENNNGSLQINVRDNEGVRKVSYFINGEELVMPFKEKGSTYLLKRSFFEHSEEIYGKFKKGKNIFMVLVQDYLGNLQKATKILENY